MRVKFVVKKKITGALPSDYYETVEEIDLGSGSMTVATAKTLYEADGAWPLKTEHTAKSGDYDATYSGETIEEYLHFCDHDVVRNGCFQVRTRGPVAV